MQGRIIGLLLALALMTPLSALATAPTESAAPTPIAPVPGTLTSTPPVPSLAMADPIVYPSARRTATTDSLPMEAGQITPSPQAAGQISPVYRRQAYAVSNYIARHNRNLRWDEISVITDAIVQYSNRYGVDYRLLTSLIAVESSFRRDVVSSSGAIGMGQLKPDTARWLGVADPYDPVDNIAGTARFLAWLTRKYNGNLERALSAYFQGPGYVDRNGVTSVCMPYLVKINGALGSLL